MSFFKERKIAPYTDQILFGKDNLANLERKNQDYQKWYRKFVENGFRIEDDFSVSDPSWYREVMIRDSNKLKKENEFNWGKGSLSFRFLEETEAVRMSIFDSVDEKIFYLPTEKMEFDTVKFALKEWHDTFYTLSNWSGKSNEMTLEQVGMSFLGDLNGMRNILGRDVGGVKMRPIWEGGMFGLWLGFCGRLEEIKANLLYREDIDYRSPRPTIRQSLF
jgi:hypothetical protein